MLHISDRLRPFYGLCSQAGHLLSFAKGLLQMKRVLRYCSSLFLVFAWVVGCAAEPPVQPPVGQGEQVPPAQPAQSDNSNSYVIGPGDILQVFVWRNPELTTSVPVRPDGKISTPLVEDMVAVGKTPSQLARDIERVLGEYIRSPQVNIIVSTPVSAFSQVRIIGQVTQPQALAYREGMTVLDAVLSVGGLGQFAAANRSKIIREENGKKREIKVKLGDLVNRGDMKQNIPLLPGDVLVVPQSIL
jgi:polysaccharide export outer membrane protein